MKTTFVSVKVQGTEIKFQEEAISSIPTSSNTAMPLKIVEEARNIDAIEINGHIEQIIFNGDSQIGKTKGNKQRKSWSKVWVDFDKFEENGKQVAKCKHCPKVLTGSSKSGTTHLNNHSKVCPGKKKQNQETQSILPVDTNERSSTFDQERSHLDLVKVVIKHQYPLDLAGQEAFKNFVKGLQPMYEFQSRDKLLSDIHRIYNEEREKLQLYFDQLACKLNLIVSLWKNNHGKTAYCCLIAHFIDDGWELKMKILGLRKLEHVYDTKVVGGIIRSFVSVWNIRKKGSLSSAYWFISFTLLEDGFREMDSILSKLWKSIEYVTETTHGKLNFQEAVNQVKLQGGKSWDELSFKLESDSDILDSALRSREIFCKLEQIDDNFMLNLSMEEWEKAATLQTETTKDCIVSYFSKFASPSNVKEVASQKSELDCYLEETLLPSDADILGWWRVNSQRFPTLAKMARDFLAIPVSVSAPCSHISAMTRNPAYSRLDPESMEALDKRKRKVEENGTSTVKVFKNRNHEKASSNGDIASDFNKNESVGEKAEIMEASVRNRDRLESSIGKPNHGRNIAAAIEIPNDEPSFNTNQLDEFQSSSSESDDETTLREQRSWYREDVRTYLVSSFTNKEKKRLNRWETSELSGK
ncbi:Putative AC transposase [Gossypium arboreum]|uniref:Putative AC transposase n=1 Tax=Gossypium arboreum TaxID=29729 RepID=A0A0B0NUE0_GOSAR|nr:Putative AC transposase [Gossypium arboreum]